MLVLLWLACAPADEVCDVGDGDTLGELTAWELEYREQQAPDELPAPVYLDMVDGLPLAYRDWVPTDWTGDGPAMLFVPGSSAHSGLYGALGAGLAEQGIYTRIVDVRGHGLSVCAAEGCGEPAAVEREAPDDGAYWVGRIGDSADEQQIVRDIGTVLADLSEQTVGALVLGGHSSGGGVVSRYVETGGGAFVDRVVLLAPYNHFDQPQIRPEVKLDCVDMAGTAYARLDLGALGDALRGNTHRYVLQLHKSAQYTDPLDTLSYSWTTMTGMAATDPVSFWDAYLPPVLLVTGSEDHLLDPDISAEQVALAPDGTFVEVPDTSHIGVIWSADVVSAIADWL